MKTQLPHLIFAHLAAILIAPALGAATMLVQEAKSPDQFLHSGALWAFIFSTLFSYLFLLIPTILSVIFLSPFVFCISRIPNPIAAAVAALLFGAAAGLLFQILFVPGSPSEFQNIVRSTTISLGATTTLALAIASRKYAVWHTPKTPTPGRASERLQTSPDRPQRDSS